MKRSTEQWEVLLEGTTEGPWVCSEDDYDAYQILGRNPDRMTFPIICDVDDVDDAELIADAPEAVAEVIRLRNGIKDVAEFITRYPLDQFLVESPTNDQRARHMQAKAATALLRILAGSREDR